MNSRRVDSWPSVNSLRLKRSRNVGSWVLGMTSMDLMRILAILTARSVVIPTTSSPPEAHFLVTTTIIATVLARICATAPNNDT